MVPAELPIATPRSRLPIRQLLPNATLIRLVLTWIVVIAFQTGWSGFTNPDPVICFIVLFSTILLAAFGVVREADHLANLLREPFGTIILTFTVVSIEVILIAAVMVGSNEAATIARDSIFAVAMIILNLVIGLCLLLGGLRYGEQEYNSQGAAAYLSMMVLLTSTGLVLPNVLSSHDGSFTLAQAGFIALLTGAVYVAFLAMQLGEYRRLFVQPEPGSMTVAYKRGEVRASDTALARVRDSRAVWIRSLVIAGLMLPIVLLAEHLALPIGVAVERAGAPAAMSGVIIAVIVFMPESITAIKAALGNEMQRVINLCLGAFLSTVGLTIPAVLAIGLLTGKTVTLGLNARDTLLIGLTLALTTLSFIGSRSSPIQGIIHLILFLTYFGLMFVS